MKRVLMTGAASMIGEGIAQALSNQGWQLILTDIDMETLSGVADRLPDGCESETARMDVTNYQEVSSVIDSCARQGPIDALVTCAGGLRGLGLQPKPIDEITPEEWHRVYDTNLKGVLNVTRCVLPVMKQANAGRIVFIAASRGIRGGARAAHYSAAKAGIIMFTQTMVVECAEYGVRINSIAPGNAEARWKTNDISGSLSPLGRITSAEDVGNAVAFLVSDAASHITGACLDISGGTTLH